MTAKAATLISLCLAAISAAQSTVPKEEAPKRLQYLTNAQIDPARLLPPPAPDGSSSQQKEMAEARNLIRNRTPERYAQAVWDAEHEDPSFFASTLGPAFDLEKLPATGSLLEGVVNDQNIAAGAAKDFFKRKFPVTAAMPEDYRDWACDQDDRKPASRPVRSNPSGHSTLAYSVGGVMADLIPEKAQAILARAADYPYSREVFSDHYHSDVEASHALGAALAQMLLENAALNRRLKPRAPNCAQRI